MEFHEPVLVQEVLEALRVAPGDVVADGTLGSAGHGLRLIEALAGRGAFIGLDRDPQMLERARGRLAAHAGQPDLRLITEARPYEELPAVLAANALKGADAVLLDLGINSLQIADPSRGFSFMADGPLDGRFDTTDPRCRPASDLVNGLEQGELADLIFTLGEERHARRIARVVCERRATKPFTSTLELASACRAAYPAKERDGRIHPATRAFQALRIAANDELGGVERGLRACLDSLAPGGRLAVIAYHSLEDKIAKRLLDEAGSPRPDPSNPYQATTTEGLDFELPRRGATKASEAEIAENPRARSARLRVIRRKGAEQ